MTHIINYIAQLLFAAVGVLGFFLYRKIAQIKKIEKMSRQNPAAGRRLAAETVDCETIDFSSAVIILPPKPQGAWYVSAQGCAG